jgi:hypothetical protein
MRFYFFVHPLAPAAQSAYEHGIIALAEGLAECGVKFYGNINYWEGEQGSKKYLINHDANIKYFDCDVVIFSSEIYNHQRLDLLPKDLFDAKRKYKLIFIDSSDIILEKKNYVTPGNYPELRKVDIVLKSHFCSKYSYPDNFVPWQFGLTNRIIESVSSKPFADRNHSVLVNYRSKHQLRDLAEKKFMQTVYSLYEKDDLSEDLNVNHQSLREQHYWMLTGRRHYQSYYERLGNTKICAVFGGFLQTKFSERPTLPHKLIRKFDSHVSFLKYDRLLQFDSWRFWESLASGCLTVHADLYKYEVVLPEMPINGIHYFGVDFSNLNFSKNNFMQTDLHESIASNGRNWVLKNYSPKAVAMRLLGIISR